MIKYRTVLFQNGVCAGTSVSSTLEKAIEIANNFYDSDKDHNCAAVTMEYSSLLYLTINYNEV